MSQKQFANKWAVILGGSSGFGLATAEKLAAHGMNIALLYRETAASEKALKQKIAVLTEQEKVSIIPFNINALDEDARKNFIEEFKRIVGEEHCVRLLLHSIARGNLKPLISEKYDIEANAATLSTEDIQLTTYAMSNSLLDWARLLLRENLFCNEASIVGLSSEGAHKYWDSYAAVSIAKASIESLATYMAVEFAKYGIRTNIIQAGVTETRSLNMIPRSKELVTTTKTRNPFGRLTTPTDVANVIYLLCTDEAAWINGSLIHVDGGEHCC